MGLRGWRWGAALCCLLLAGCAGKLPRSVSMSGEERRQALERWEQLQRAQQPAAVDGDFRLRWDVLGNKGGIDAVVQMQQPAHLRFSANDPLGRPLILAVADGSRFTFVDSREGRVYQGKTDAKFWRRYVPEAVQPADLFFYLGGQIDGRQAVGVQPARDEAGQGIWYSWRDNRSLQHHVLLDPQGSRVGRHLLFDRSGTEILDVRYSGVVQKVEAGNGLSWPEKIEVRGEAVSGTIELHTQKIYDFAVRGAAVFRVTPPPSFTVEQVE